MPVPEENSLPAPIPVTILSGFLGAGKTTLLRYLLQAEHGLKIAVIENEFAETSIDSRLLGEQPVKVMTLANGCVCCSVRSELELALFTLLEQRDKGDVAFDRLVIECTGLADPAPVAQTFFVDETLRERYILDGILTLVDAAHAPFQLDMAIAQAQVGFADRILVSKTDLVDKEHYQNLCQRLQHINRRASILPVEQGRIDLNELLEIRGFNLNDDLADSLQPVSSPFISLRPVSTAPRKEDRIASLVLRTSLPLDLERLSQFMEALLDEFGNALLRYKGVLNLENETRRMVFQGVLRLYGFDWDREWHADEPRESIVVLIGDSLPEERLRQTFLEMAGQ